MIWTWLCQACCGLRGHTEELAIEAHFRVICVSCGYESIGIDLAESRVMRFKRRLHQTRRRAR